MNIVLFLLVLAIVCNTGGAVYGYFQPRFTFWPLAKTTGAFAAGALVAIGGLKEVTWGLVVGSILFVLLVANAVVSGFPKVDKRSGS